LRFRFPLRRVWRQLSTGMLRRVVWQMFTDVLEVPAASTTAMPTTRRRPSSNHLMTCIQPTPEISYISADVRQRAMHDTVFLYETTGLPYRYQGAWQLAVRPTVPRCQSIKMLQHTQSVCNTGKERQTSRLPRARTHLVQRMQTSSLKATKRSVRPSSSDQQCTRQHFQR
jgi:hypothetical protein